MWERTCPLQDGTKWLVEQRSNNAARRFSCVRLSLSLSFFLRVQVAYYLVQGEREYRDGEAEQAVVTYDIHT